MLSCEKLAVIYLLSALLIINNNNKMEENNDDLKNSHLDLMEEVQASVIICDIEGTTTSISFVKDVLFPYAIKNVRKFLTKSWDIESTIQRCLELKLQCNADKVNQIPIPIDITQDEEWSIDDKIKNITEYVKHLIEQDRKVEALKNLQGLIWEEGFRNGVLEGHIFDDVPKAFDNWIEAGAKIYIYSSGSITAQKLLFHYSKFGNLLPKITGHFDLTIGRKIETKSYTKILNELDIISSSNHYSDVLFFTDSIAEARAAKLAEINVILLDRPGNDEYSSETQMEFKIIKSFEHIKIIPPSRQSSLNTELNIFYMLAENPNAMSNEWGPSKGKSIKEIQETSAITSKKDEPPPPPSSSSSSSTILTEQQIRNLIENNNMDDTIVKLKEKIKNQQKTIDAITNDIAESTDSIGLEDIKKKNLLMELERKNLEMNELEKKRKHIFDNQKRSSDKRERTKEKAQSTNGKMDIVENLNKAQIKKMLENNLKGKPLMAGVEELAKLTSTTLGEAIASTPTSTGTNSTSTSTETINDVNKKEEFSVKTKDKKKNKKKHKHNKKGLLASIEENPKLEMETTTSSSKSFENNTQSYTNDKNVTINVKPKFDTVSINPFYDINVIQENPMAAAVTEAGEQIPETEQKKKKNEERKQKKQEMKANKKLQKKKNKQLRAADNAANEKKQNEDVNFSVKSNESEAAEPNLTVTDLSISNENLNVKLSKAKKKKLNKKAKINDSTMSKETIMDAEHNPKLNIETSENTIEIENVEVESGNNNQNVGNVTGKKKKKKNTKKQNNMNAVEPDQVGERTTIVEENNNNNNTIIETDESIEIARTIEKIAKQKLKQLRRKYKQKQKQQQIIEEQMPDDDQIEIQPPANEENTIKVGEPAKVNNKNKKKNKKEIDDVVQEEEEEAKSENINSETSTSINNNNGLNGNRKLHINVDDKEKPDMLPDEISDKKKSKKNNKRKRNRAVNKDGDELHVEEGVRTVDDGMTTMTTNNEGIVNQNEKCQNLENKEDNVEKQTLEKTKKRKKTKELSKKDPIMPENDNNLGIVAGSITDEHKQDGIRIDRLEPVKVESKKRNGKRGRGGSKKTNIVSECETTTADNENVIEMNNDIIINENPSSTSTSAAAAGSSTINKDIDTSIKVDEEINNVVQEEPIMKQQNAKRKRKAYGPRDTAKILRSTKIIETADY